MKLASLRERVLFQVRGTTADDIGNRMNVWQDAYRSAADVSDSAGTEKTEAGTITDVHTITVQVRACRFFSGLRSTDLRLLWRGGVYDIVFIDHRHMRGDLLKLTCEAVRDERQSG